MEPLTPPGCDLRDFAFMPLDVVRLRDSDLAALEAPEACWAAVLLWCASWHQIPAASLPDDDRVLANLAGFGRVVKEWQRVRGGALRGWVLCTDGRLYHPVIAEKANDAWNEKHAYRERKAKRIAAAKVAAESRWHNEDDANRMPNASSNDANRIEKDTNRITDASLTTCRKGEGQEQGEVKGQEQGEGQGIINTRSKANSKDLSTPSAQTTKNGTRLSADWVLPKAWGEWALSEKPELTADSIRAIAEQFRDYWHSIAGAKARRADWLATWRNWIRNQKIATHFQTASERRMAVTDASIDAWLSEGSGNVVEGECVNV